MWVLRPPQRRYGVGVAALLLLLSSTRCVVLLLMLMLMFCLTWFFFPSILIEMKEKRKYIVSRNVKSRTEMCVSRAPLWSPWSVFCFSDLFNYANKTEWKNAPRSRLEHIRNGEQNVLPICECAKVQVYPLAAWLYMLTTIHFHPHIYFNIKHAVFLFWQKEKSVFFVVVVYRIVTIAVIVFVDIIVVVKVL